MKKKKTYPALLGEARSPFLFAATDVSPYLSILACNTNIKY